MPEAVARPRTKNKKGRNTASFDPTTTHKRPDLRVVVANPCRARLPKGKLSHDDVVIVPELLCAEDDYSVYHKLLAEMKDMGVQWTSWHENSHLIQKTPDNSPTFQAVLKRLSEYFNVRAEKQGTRFNWYKDASDWKPFHADSAAFNPQRARNQNITVGASFGAERELSFLHVGKGTDLAFPQTNGTAFSFGRDVNIRFQHGIRALPPDKQSTVRGAVEVGGGRISIVLWGFVEAVDEDDPDSPPMLNNETRGLDRGGRGGGRGGPPREARGDAPPRSPATPPQ